MTSEEDHLIFEMPTGHGDGCTPYVQFAGFGSGTALRAEVSGNAFLAPMYALDLDDSEMLRAVGWQGNDDENPNWFIECAITLAGVAAVMAIGALRDVLKIGHPQLLTYDAFGPNADGAREVGLSATEDVPVEEVPAAKQPILQPSGRHELIEMVGATLRDHLGELPPFEVRGGHFVLTHLDQPVWVRVRNDQPAVEILARVTRGVHSRRATAADITVLNRRHMWTQWVLHDRAVWMRLPIPALPFAPAHLSTMVDVFLDAMTKTRDDLAFRVGGTVG
ncbi:hypothetical protein EUA94_13310 [Nocardioides zhouii]|uniref:YbjN domain-containing protein n=2 Tax=Nocardioides zhouii TaxID=1168729 RepID=A0A4Q2T1B7_9ACTN|nr:hypothetical protein [Nocardioides zhouii]RYC10498.1 hypothetical protein EUA94_13310 [Nocardioides zhouii]